MSQFPHICAVVRAGMFSCLNIIRIIVLEGKEKGMGCERKEGDRQLAHVKWDKLFYEAFFWEKKSSVSICIIQINWSQISLSFFFFFQSFGTVSFCGGGAAIGIDEGLSKTI